MEVVKVRSVTEFVDKVLRHQQPHAWFRGEPGDVKTSLLPKLYRERPDGSRHHENKLLQSFRRQAPTYADVPCPERKATDQWLFLAQHVGLPTRLLDWTDSALIALQFALVALKPIVWTINPFDLNRQTVADAPDEFGLTWHQPEGAINVSAENINCAWQCGQGGVPRPVAIPPTNIHPRISAQRSFFTVHGTDNASLVDQLPSLLKCYEVEPSERPTMRKDLHLLGIGFSTVWPSLDGLAKDLAELY
jgi:hypothetical protein